MQHDLRLAFDIADRKYGNATQRVESKLHVGSSELADVLAIARKRVISNTPIETPRASASRIVLEGQVQCRVGTKQAQFRPLKLSFSGNALTI